MKKRTKIISVLSAAIGLAVFFLIKIDYSFEKFEINDIVSREMITEELGAPTFINTIEKPQGKALYEYQNGILKNLKPEDSIVYEYFYYEEPIKKYFWFVPVGDSLRMVDKLKFNSKKVQY